MLGLWQDGVCVGEVQLSSGRYVRADERGRGSAESTSRGSQAGDRSALNLLRLTASENKVIALYAAVPNCLHEDNPPRIFDSTKEKRPSFFFSLSLSPSFAMAASYSLYLVAMILPHYVGQLSDRNWVINHARGRASSFDRSSPGRTMSSTSQRPASSRILLIPLTTTSRSPDTHLLVSICVSTRERPLENLEPNTDPSSPPFPHSPP
jgi:hypothetical protein